MSVSFFFSLIMILVAAPYMTHQMFSESYSHQTTQIALDNAAIKLGQKDRSTLNFIESSNRLIKLIERFHDPVHLAVNSGAGTSYLVAQDQIFESSIKEIHSGALEVASLRWLESFLSANGELHRLKRSLLQKKRANKVPLMSKRCPVCGREVLWEINTAKTESMLRVLDESWTPGLRINLIPIKRQGQTNWNYQLSEQEINY